MAYTAVKGGAAAIEAAERLVARIRRDPDEARLEVRQALHQLRHAVDQAMGEGGLYAPELAALAVLQCEGDLFEASFMLRAYRSTLPRLAAAKPAAGSEMRVRRRISSAFKDVPGGQILGRTRDYTQRLLDVDRVEASDAEPFADASAAPQGRLEKVSDTMRAIGMMPPTPPPPDEEPFDITRQSLRFPAPRSAWLQGLARGETGAMVCLAYSAQRGYGGGGDHGTIGELRVGDLPLRVVHPLVGEAATIGWVRATEVEMFGPSRGADGKKSAGYGLSYGMVFGQNERKAIAMAMLDSSLQAAEGQPGGAPASDQEMVLYHVDGIESNGFVEHLKLPHFVTFGSGLQLTLEAEGASLGEGAR